MITARKIDVGDLVAASGATTATQGNAPSQNGTPTQELFRIAQTKLLRVYVNVPENYSDSIVPGISATLDLASSPHQKVTGKLVRTSQSIDPTSLTLLAEVDVPNPDGQLLPGGYAQVHFDITTAQPPMVIPGNLAHLPGPGRAGRRGRSRDPDGAPEGTSRSDATSAQNSKSSTA